MRPASIATYPFKVGAAERCKLRFCRLHTAVAHPLSCIQDTPVTPGLRAADSATVDAANYMFFPAPAKLRFAAATASSATPVAACSAAAATAVPSPRRAYRGRLPGRWILGGAEGAALARLSLSSSAEGCSCAAQLLLLAFFSFTAAPAASLATRSVRHSIGHSMHRLSPLSSTLPVKVAAAVAAAGGDGAARDVVHIPRLLYGTAWKKERTEDLVYTALRHGFRGVDTACQPKHYNEPGVGRGIARFLRETQLPRSSLFIQTKFTPVDGHDLSQPLPYDARASVAEQVRQSLQTSLHNLQCEYLDAVLLHSPLPTIKQTMEAWRVLEAAVEGGKIRLLGVSNCYDVSELEALHRAAKIKPALLQNRFYRDTAYDAEVRAFCEQHDMVYEAFWTLTANPHMLHSHAVQQAAARTGSTPVQVWFRYLLEKGFVVLTGTTSVHHMQEDLQSLSIEFSREDRDAVDQEVASYT